MKVTVSKNDTKKRKRDSSCDHVVEGPKKAKVHAQRKFAQGSAYNSSPITIIKDKVRPPASVSSPNLVLSAKRPNTEDFLTFLCFRRTSILPPKLDFFKDGFIQHQQPPQDREQPIQSNSVQKTTNSSPGSKNQSDTNTKSVSKRNDKNETQKKSQTPVQALRQKYQEQRLAKQNPTNVTKLAKKVKGKNMMRTRSSTVKEEAPKPEKKVAKVKDSKSTVTRLRSGLQRSLPASPKSVKKKKNPIEMKNLRSRIKGKVVSNKSVPKQVEVKKVAKNPPRDVSPKKVEPGKGVKTSVMIGKFRDFKTNVKKIEGLSDFSSDDNEPLLAVRKGKASKSERLTNGIKEVPSSNTPKTRARGSITESTSSRVSVRPTRKTKEAAAIYMEMITKKLVSPEKSGDEDRSSVDSFPELPNAKRNEQRESEIKAKALALKKGGSRETSERSVSRERSSRSSSAFNKRKDPGKSSVDSISKSEPARKLARENSTKKAVKEELPKRVIREASKKIVKAPQQKRPVREDAPKKTPRDEPPRKVAKDDIRLRSAKEDSSKKPVKEEKRTTREETNKKESESYARKVVKEEAKVSGDEIPKKMAREETCKKGSSEEVTKKMAGDTGKKIVKEEPPKGSVSESASKKSEPSKKPIKEENAKRSSTEDLSKKAREDCNKKGSTEEVSKKMTREESNKRGSSDELTKKVTREESGKKGSSSEELVKKPPKEENMKKGSCEDLAKKVVKDETQKTASNEGALKKVEAPKKPTKEETSKKSSQEDLSKKPTKEEPPKKIVAEEAQKTIAEPPKKVTKEDVMKEDQKLPEPKTKEESLVKNKGEPSNEAGSSKVSGKKEAVPEEKVKEIAQDDATKRKKKDEAPRKSRSDAQKTVSEAENATKEAVKGTRQKSEEQSEKRDSGAEASPRRTLRSPSKEDEAVKYAMRSSQTEKKDAEVSSKKVVKNPSKDEIYKFDAEAEEPKEEERYFGKSRKGTDRTSAVKKTNPVVRKGSGAGSSWLPPIASGSNLVEAPTFYPTEKEFQDPLEFFDKIRPEAENFGLCRIVPPSTFKPDCKVSDDMRFTAYNQYVHRMFHRWGPNIKEMMAIKKYLATQSISLKQPPWIGGIEVDLPRLYQSVQNCGGLMKVMEKKKWNQVADMMRIPKAAQDRVTKLDDIYCKYLLPYDTLSHDERQRLFDEVESDWLKRQENTSEGADEDSEEEVYIDECEECIVKGRNMALNQFFRIARNTMSMWFRSQEPAPGDVENEFWRHVSERNNHVCVHSGSIDSSGWGYGFPVAKNNPFSRHPWNLKVLTNNSGSVLRSLGPVMGVTVPTLHVGMVFTAFCWYRDPHGLPWVEYLHTGAPKIWYGISDDNSAVFKEALTKLLPRYIKNKKIWLPSDTAMVPPAQLVEQGVSLCHTIQKPGQFILVFPRAFTSSICTGYLVSESVYFAQPSWLTTAEQVFKDIQNCCEPTMFSLEKLLLSIAVDTRSSVEVLKQVLPMVWHIKQNEVDGRKTLFNLGLKTSERLPAKDQSGNKKKGRWAQDGEGDYECDVCRKNLCMSLVINSHEEGVLCLPHAIEALTQKRHQLKYCKLMYSYTQEELCEVIEKLEQRIESKSQRKVTNKSTGNAK